MSTGDVEVLYPGKHLRLVLREGWECVDRPGSTGIVGILAVTDAGEIVLVEQRRRALAGWVIEMPAGLVGDEPGGERESFETACQRELLEETGYEADGFELLTAGPPSPGVTSEVITFYRARGLRRVGEGGGTESEELMVRVVPLAEVETWLEAKRASGVLVDPKVYLGLFFAGLRHRPG